MQIVNSVNGIPIRLTEERWRHIIERHPEMGSEQEKVCETVTLPEKVLQGDSGERLAVRFYVETPLTRKFLVVAYREIASNDGFILTAYFTNRLSTRRAILWTQ